jgi:hypothetical protein
MSNFVKKYPAISMYIVASIIGGGMLAGIIAGVLPEIFFLIAAFSASLAGIILTAIVSGKAGLKEMFRRLLIWRVGVGWWAFAMFAYGLFWLGGIALAVVFTDPAPEISLAQPLYMFFPLLIQQFFFDSGLGEELGWRGFLLPRLQARYNALVSSIIVGIAWGLWHLPLFLVEGMPYYQMGQTWGVVPGLLAVTFFVTVSWSILYTWIYNNTRGSLVLAFVFHASQAWFAILTVSADSFLNSYIGYMATMSITAIVVVLIYGAQNLSRRNERIMLHDA